MTTTPTWTPTPEQCDWLRDEMAKLRPELSFSVEVRDGVICLDAQHRDNNAVPA
jgi:hypothetical protein